MRLLLDEHISPALVARLAEVGIYAQSVPHVGLAGRADHEIWQYALDHDFAVVTTNARDFIELLDVDVHPGLIVLRESGLSRDEQWRRIQPHAGMDVSTCHSGYAALEWLQRYRCFCHRSSEC